MKKPSSARFSNLSSIILYISFVSPKEFKDVVSKNATLIGLIVLPQTFTNQNHIGKSILIGRKGELSDYQMSIIKMEDELSQENLEMTFVKILNMFKEIGGNKNA